MHYENMSNMKIWVIWNMSYENMSNMKYEFVLVNVSKGGLVQIHESCLLYRSRVMSEVRILKRQVALLAIVRSLYLRFRQFFRIAHFLSMLHTSYCISCYILHITFHITYCVLHFTLHVLFGSAPAKHKGTLEERHACWHDHINTLGSAPAKHKDTPHYAAWRDTGDTKIRNPKP